MASVDRKTSTDRRPLSRKAGAASRAPLGRSMALCASAMLSGCFAYVPTEFDRIAVGEQVQVHLSRTAMADMLLASPDSAMPEITPVVKGMVSRKDPDGFFVRVPIVSAELLIPRASFGRDVRITAADVDRVERRHVDLMRTAAMTAGVIGVAVVLTYIIMDGAGGEGIPDPSGGNNIRIPLP